MKNLLFILLMSVGLLHATSIKNPIEVGTGNAYRPFAFVNENNQIDGYDIDVLKILSKYDKSLVFKFNGVQWNAIFPGLDSAKYDILAYQITKTKEREEKYIFSNYPYFNDISGVIVRENQNITDFTQLDKQKIGVSVGSNYARDLENYLKSHPNLVLSISLRHKISTLRQQILFLTKHLYILFLIKKMWNSKRECQKPSKKP